MSTSFLYYGFGIRGYKYVRNQYENGYVLLPYAEIRKK